MSVIKKGQSYGHFSRDFATPTIMDRVRTEMRRADRIHGANRHLTDREWYDIAHEELFEVFDAVAGIGDPGHGVRDELHQLIGVCLHWLDDIESRGESCQD